MTVAAELPARPLTLDDVTRLAEADTRHRFELSEGNLIVMPPGTWRHQEIAGLLFTWFLAHGFRGRVNIAPEAVALAVEIVSKGSERTDRWLKPVGYAEAGIPLFWRVEPDDIVVRFHLDGKRYVEHGSITLDALLAGDVPSLS